MRCLIATVLLFASLFASAQSGTSSFSREGYRYPRGTDSIAMISFTTENSTDRFFTALEQKWGAPRQEEAILIYLLGGKNWQKEKVVVRVEPAMQIDGSNRRRNVFFITVQTESGTDLLRPDAKEAKEIIDYFETLYKQTVVTAPKDRFDQ